MLTKVINWLEDEITSLKERTAQEIKGVYAYLSRPGASSKVRPRILEHKGYSTFSIVWHKLVYYDFAQRKGKYKLIRKGRGYLVPKARLLTYCRNCESWEFEYLWQRELGFSHTRKLVSLLSLSLTAVKRYCAWAPEQCISTCMPGTPLIGADEVLSRISEALKSLEDRTSLQVIEVNARLEADAHMSLRARIVKGTATASSVEWVKQNGCDPSTGLQTHRQIPREGKYSIRRVRLLAHCRSCDEETVEFVWKRELEFASARRQFELLNQAIRALKRYNKQSEQHAA